KAATKRRAEVDAAVPQRADGVAMVAGPPGGHRQIRRGLDSAVAATERQSGHEYDGWIGADTKGDQPRQRETDPTRKHEPPWASIAEHAGEPPRGRASAPGHEQEHSRRAGPCSRKGDGRECDDCAE